MAGYSAGGMRSIFESLVDNLASKSESLMIWTKTHVDEVIQKINEANLAIEMGKAPTKPELHYCTLYDILSVDGIERVISKKARLDGSVRIMLPREEYFDTIFSYHEKIGHVGLERLYVAVRQRFVILKEIVHLFVLCCKNCSKKSAFQEDENENVRFRSLHNEPARKGWNSVPAYNQRRDLPTAELQLSGDGGAAHSHTGSRTNRVPQPPPVQKPPTLTPPQPQPQKIIPPQQIPAPKPIAPKPQQVAQPVSPLQPLPPPPEVCLRWNSYHSNMQATFPSLLNNEQFVDVTLACEGRSIKCHKMMLSACSAYFEELLSQNPCQHPIVLMKDLKYWEVQALVDFMYRGEVNVGQDKLPSLLAAAEALQIKGLAGPAFSSNDEDNNSQAAAPASTGEEYLDESTPSPSSARRARKRRVMSSTLSPRVQTSQSQPISTSPKSSSGKRTVRTPSIPSTSSTNYELETPNMPSEPPLRRARKSEADLVGEIKIEPIDIEISNDSMDQMEDNFLDKNYDESEGGEDSNCLGNDPGGTTDSKNLELDDAMKSLHGHDTDHIDYGTNNSTSGSDQNFKFEDGTSQDAGLATITDLPGTSYQESLVQPSSSGMNSSNSSVGDSLLGHM